MMMTDNSISNYFTALSHIDRSSYLACFSPDAVVMDPYGGRPLQGTDELNKFMDGMQHTWSDFSMSPGESFAAGDRVAINWTVKAKAKNGKSAEFSGINVFTINDDGLISRLEAYWDFKAMLAQIS